MTSRRTLTPDQLRPAGLLVPAVIALVLTAACGGGGNGVSPTATPATSAPTTTAPATPPATGTTVPGTTVPVPTATPGKPISIRPTAGDVLAVVGVAHDDVLNIRRGPGVAFPVLATVPPLADNVVATGRGWQVTSGSVWYEVSRSGVTGWAHSHYLAWRDGTRDVTSGVVARVGHVPVAETMLDLGREVAEAMVAGPEESRVTMSVAPSVGDLGEVTYDVVGLSDDSIWALRLHVFGQPTASGEGFSLKSVEATSFCARGVTGDLCV